MTFIVDMNCVANVEGDNLFDPATNDVLIVGMGLFEEDWPAATEALKDDDGDLIYEGTWTGPAGDYDFLVTFYGDDDPGMEKKSWGKEIAPTNTETVLFL